MKTLPIFCFLTLMAGSTMAKERVTFDDLLLEDGTTLKNVVVLKVEPDGLRLEHKNGVSKVKYENLPEMVQKKFAFDREKAEAFRVTLESAREAKAAEERKARVEKVLEQRKDEQDGDFQRAREAFFKVMESDEYSYPQLDKTITDTIAILTDAGRKDLADILQDDRKLLRERELVRPGEKYRHEREELLARIRNLENQADDQNDNTQEPVVVNDGLIPFYVNPPLLVDYPWFVDRPGCLPTFFPTCPTTLGPVPPRRGSMEAPPRTGTVSRPPRVNAPAGPLRPIPAALPPVSSQRPIPANLSRPSVPSYTPRPSGPSTSTPRPSAAPAFTPHPSPAPAFTPRPSAPAAPSLPPAPVSLPSSGGQSQAAHSGKNK